MTIWKLNSRIFSILSLCSFRWTSSGNFCYLLSWRYSTIVHFCDRFGKFPIRQLAHFIQLQSENWHKTLIAELKKCRDENFSEGMKMKRDRNQSWKNQFPIDCLILFSMKADSMMLIEKRAHHYIMSAIEHIKNIHTTQKIDDSTSFFLLILIFNTHIPRTVRCLPPESFLFVSVDEKLFYYFIRFTNFQQRWESIFLAQDEKKITDYCTLKFLIFTPAQTVWRWCTCWFVWITDKNNFSPFFKQ